MMVPAVIIPHGIEDDMSMDEMYVGERLRKLREARGWTQAQLAYKAGVNSTTISRIERGASGPPHKTTVQTLARVLGALEDTPSEETDLQRVARLLDRLRAYGLATQGQGPLWEALEEYVEAFFTTRR